MVRKPEGVDETEKLLRVLVRVPKKELDARLKEREKRIAKKRAAKRKK